MTDKEKRIIEGIDAKIEYLENQVDYYRWKIDNFENEYCNLKMMNDSYKYFAHTLEATKKVRDFIWEIIKD